MSYSPHTPVYTPGDPSNQYHERGLNFFPTVQNGVSPLPFPSPPVSQPHHLQDRAGSRSNPSPPNRPGSAAASIAEPENKVQKEVLHVVMRESATLNDLTALFQWVLRQPGFKVFAFLSRWHQFLLLFLSTRFLVSFSTFLFRAPQSEYRVA